MTYETTRAPLRRAVVGAIAAGGMISPSLVLRVFE
jgi:hypothetical protein